MPINAVNTSTQEPWVLRVTDGKTERVNVTLGLRDPRTERVLVASGLRYEAYNMCDRSCRAGLIASFEISLVGAPERRR